MVILNEDRVGVRALRKFADGYRAKHCPVGVEVDPAVKVNEPWRRIANMTVEQEALLDRKERRAGIRALVKWIEEWVRENCQKSEVKSQRSGEGSFAGASMLVAPTDLSRLHSLRSCPPSPAGGEGNGLDVARGGCVSGELGGTRWDIGCGVGENWDSGAVMGAEGSGALLVASRPSPLGWDTQELDEVWACEGQGRQVVEEVCLELNISKWQLGKLIREYRGITASELIDGFRVRAVKGKIGELLRGYARELWLSPGLYVGVLLMDERLKVYGEGTSEYFVDPTEDFRKQELYETISERREALLEKFDTGWKRGELSRDGFAVELGFRSFSELNRACLNVYGKTVRQLAWGIGCEIVDYYLAREQQEMYALAFCPKASVRVVRARYLYHGSAELPAGAVSRATLWDAMDAAWRAEMGAWLGAG